MRTQESAGRPPDDDWRSFVVRNRSILTALGVAALWFGFVSRYLFSPWIQGVDAITRIYHIDKTIVVLNYNPWLPGMQLVLQAVHLFADSAMAYEMAAAVVAMAAMVVFFLVIDRLLGYWTALFSCAYFFLDNHWRLIGTSPYMEGLLLLTVSLSVYCYLKGLPWLSRLFFVFATFTRPEPLLAAPAILLAHLVYYRSWQRTFRFGLMYVPITIYYVGLKFFLPSFESPDSYSAGESRLLFDKLTAIFRLNPTFTVVGVAALLGVAVVLLDRDLPREKRKQLFLVLGAIALFYFTFVVVLPIIHDFTVGGTRPTMLLAFPMSLFAAIFFSFLHSRWPRATLIVFFGLLVPVLAQRYVKLSPDLPPLIYSASTTVQQGLVESGYEEQDVFYSCEIDAEQLQGPGVYDIYYRPFYLYFRLAGWSDGRYLADPETRSGKRLPPRAGCRSCGSTTLTASARSI